jgi:hypothetical protein
MKTNLLNVLALVCCAGTRSIAAADTIQPLPGIPTIPPALQNNPYVQSIINSLGGVLQSTQGNHAQGKVTFFKRFELQVLTAPRVYREVHLHRGTVINPRGMTLSLGQTVEVSGAAQSDGSLDADVVTVR